MSDNEMMPEDVERMIAAKEKSGNPMSEDEKKRLRKLAQGHAEEKKKSGK